MMSRPTLLFSLLVASVGLVTWTTPASAQAPRRWHGPYTEESQPDIFYNLYVPGAGGTPAAAYPAPLPTPPIVGHTYYTYQPFMPAEWMYHHHRSYHQYYNQGRGLNRTKVKWYSPPLRTALHDLHNHFELAR
ncbi:MAG: hypothetical protein U0795_15410 [Pirellulales bacterium]